MTEDKRYSRKSLHIQARDDFLNRIATGAWRPRQEIPSEAELAKELSISLGTIRKAFDIVVSYGLMERQQGRGSHIVDFRSDSYIERFHNVYDKSENPIFGDVDVLDHQIIPADIVLSVGSKFIKARSFLTFRRVSSFHGQNFMVERVLQPLAEHQTDVVMEEMVKMSIERWRHGQLPLSFKSYVSPHIIGVDDQICQNLLPAGPCLKIEKYILSQHEEVIEHSLGFFASGDDLSFISK